MAAFIKAFLFVVAGEMGDKTQLLAMAMAAKYKAGQVMIGVFIATLLNHALAVMVGSYLSVVIPIDIIEMVAGASFLAFGLWTIHGDSSSADKDKKSKFGPIMTVGIAFFLVEMGDKTQLMTITLAAEFREPLAVLMGTTLGMMVANGIGILFGAWICKHLSQSSFKWIVGTMFMVFGTWTLYDSVPARLLTPTYIIPYFLLLGALTYLIGAKSARKDQPICETISDNNDVADGSRRAA